jgi:hypothetical protein
MVSGFTVPMSLTAEQGLPPINTVSLKGQMVFDGGRTLQVDRIIPGANPMALMMYLIPPATLLSENPHQRLLLERMDMDVQVQPQQLSGVVSNVSLDRIELQPGQRLGLTIEVQPYGQPAVRKRASMKIPPHTPPGQYSFFVLDPNRYVELMLMSRPHLLRTENVDELFELVQRLLKPRGDSVYLMLQLDKEALAVGRQEFPNLPSSKRALMQTPTNTRATTYRSWLDQRVPLGIAAQGVFGFTINVLPPHRGQP